MDEASSRTGRLEIENFKILSVLVEKVQKIPFLDFPRRFFVVKRSNLRKRVLIKIVCTEIFFIKFGHCIAEDSNFWFSIFGPFFDQKIFNPRGGPYDFVRVPPYDFSKISKFSKNLKSVKTGVFGTFCRFWPKNIDLGAKNKAPRCQRKFKKKSISVRFLTLDFQLKIDQKINFSKSAKTGFLALFCHYLTKISTWEPKIKLQGANENSKKCYLDGQYWLGSRK